MLQSRLALFLALALLACGQADKAPGQASVEGRFVCGGRDYRLLANLPALLAVNDFVPRNDRTPSQKEALESASPLWLLQDQPTVKCNARNQAELSFTEAGSPDFATAQRKLMITIAPAGELLDPAVHARMLSLATTLDEALAELRSKPCSSTGAPCDLKRNPDPLEFSGTKVAYTLSTEFPKIGRRAWQQYSAQGGAYAQRILFTSTDERFDFSVFVYMTAADEILRSSFHILPERLSNEYDKLTKR